MTAVFHHASDPAVWFPAIRAGSGADVFTERLCAALRARGIRAEITWLRLRAEYAPWSVPVPPAPAWATIVHINSWLPPRFVPEHLPVVVTVHHGMYDSRAEGHKSFSQKAYHRFWIRRIETINIRRASAVVGVSHYVAGQVHQHFGRDDAVAIANGIDTESRFLPAFPRQEPHRPFRLLYVGNWTRLKGVDLLPAILHRLGPGFELLYTADRGGAHRRFNLPDNTRCLGRLDPPALARAYQEADALLLPSRSEGFGLTVIEAMACGLPVITSDIRPLSDIVTPGREGLLCAPDDIAAFCEAARWLHGHPAYWRAMAAAARRRAEEHFSLTRQAEAYETLYRVLLAQKDADDAEHRSRRSA